MTVKYDKNANAIYFKFSSAEVDQTKNVHDDVNIDLDTVGQVVGIEVLNYSNYDTGLMLSLDLSGEDEWPEEDVE